MNLPQDLAQIREIVSRVPIRRISSGPARHPRIVLYAAAHEGESVEAAQERLALARNDSEFLERTGVVDCDLRLYELDLEHPVTQLKQDDLASTIAYGMTAIEPGPDLFCLGGVAVADEVLRTVSAALERKADPMTVLAQKGGRDTAALFGALTAARIAAVPVVIDGAQAIAAATLMHAIAPHALSHCRIPAASPHRDLALRLEIEPLVFAPHDYPMCLVAAIEAWRLAPHGFT